MSRKEEVLGFQGFKVDAFVKRPKKSLLVIPAQARIQSFQWVMDSRLRGSDGMTTFYDFIEVYSKRL